jgi:hypothetical protein
MNVDFKIETEGEYHLVVRSPRGDREYRFKNLITDGGIDRFLGLVGGVLGPYSSFYVQIGTGTATPANADGSLQNRSASTNTWTNGVNNAYTVGPPDYVTMTNTARFALGALNGNYTEVGIGWASAGSLWSRALILDAGGNPTSIQVLSDEQLDVTYIVRFYPQQTDSTGTVTLSGSNYDFVIRPAFVNQMFSSGYGWSIITALSSGLQGAGGVQMNAYDGVIGARTAGPSGTSTNCSPSVAWQTYVAGSFVREARWTVDLSFGNVAGGIKSVMFGFWSGSLYSSWSYQAEFTPKIPKDGTKRLRLDVRYSIARRP